VTHIDSGIVPDPNGTSFWACQGNRILIAGKAGENLCQQVIIPARWRDKRVRTINTSF
jgi:hypothetical protein